MIDPNMLADLLERDGGDNQFVMIDRAELLVILAALRRDSATQQPLPDQASRLANPRPTVFRANGQIELFEPPAFLDGSLKWHDGFRSAVD